MLDAKTLAWAEALDPALIAKTASQRHVQSVIEDLVSVVCRRSAEIERLTDEQISEIEDWFSNEFGLEAKHSTDFARAIETACGVTLPPTGSPA